MPEICVFIPEIYINMLFHFIRVSQNNTIFYFLDNFLHNWSMEKIKTSLKSWRQDPSRTFKLWAVMSIGNNLWYFSEMLIFFHISTFWDTLMTNDKTKKVVVETQLFWSPPKSFRSIALKKWRSSLMGDKKWMNATQLWIKQFCLEAKNKSLRGQKDGFFSILSTVAL